MAQKKLADYQINNGTQVGIRGKVTYSHISSKLSGKALELANQNSKFPSTEGYYTISVEVEGKNASEVFVNLNTKDPSEMELAKYVFSHIFESKKEENAGKKFFRANSKAPNPPRVFTPGPDGKLIPVDLNGNELASGCEVTLIMNYFTTKYNPGVGLNAVIVKDIQLFTPSAPRIKGYDVADPSQTIKCEPAQGSTQAAPAADNVPADGVGGEETDVDAAFADAFTPIAEVNKPADGDDDSFNAALDKFFDGQ